MITSSRWLLLIIATSRGQRPLCDCVSGYFTVVNAPELAPVPRRRLQFDDVQKCRKKKSLPELNKTKNKESCPARRLGSLCAKKCTISVKENTARALHSRRLPLA